MNAPTIISYQRAAELFAIRKTAWSVAEYRELAARYADATFSFKLAIENEDLAGIFAAYLELQEIAQQTLKMNDGLQHALEPFHRSPTP